MIEKDLIAPQGVEWIAGISWGTWDIWVEVTPEPIKENPITPEPIKEIVTDKKEEVVSPEVVVPKKATKEQKEKLVKRFAPKVEANTTPGIVRWRRWEDRMSWEDVNYWKAK